MQNEKSRESTTTIYAQAEWDSGYEAVRYEVAGDRDLVAKWLDQKIPEGDGSVFEVGCYPGGYLARVGSKGYEVSGIDLTPRVDPEMRDWLIQSDVKVGEIVKGDFFKDLPAKKYDYVYSLGFIEHFTNWKEVLLKHTELVKDGGKLLVSVPNYQGWIQYWAHKLLDRPSFEMHYLPSMDPFVWKAILEERGFEVEECGYYGHYDFWVGPQKKPLLIRLVYYGFRMLTPILRFFLRGPSAAYSPYCVISAQKRPTRTQIKHSRF